MAAKKKEKSDEKKRSTMVVNMDPQTNEFVNRWLAKNRGWGKAEFMRMLVEWFTRAPESVQQVVAGSAPSDLRDVYLARMTEYFRSLLKVPPPSIGDVASPRETSPRPPRSHNPVEMVPKTQ